MAGRACACTGRTVRRKSCGRASRALLLHLSAAITPPRQTTRSDLHHFKPHAPVDEPGEETLDVLHARDPVHKRRRANEIGALHEFKARVGQFKTVGVEGAPGVRDQHDAFDTVNLDEELELIDDALLFEVRLRMPREARRPARERDAVISRQPQAVLQKVVEVFPDAPVGAVDRRRVDALGVVRHAALVRRGGLGHGRPA